jgi:hypothetical protein
MTEQPALRIVRGTPTDEELAALVAVLASVGAAPNSTLRRTRSAWAAPDRLVRQPVRGGTWSSSYAPR